VVVSCTVFHDSAPARWNVIRTCAPDRPGTVPARRTRLPYGTVSRLADISALGEEADAASAMLVVVAVAAIGSSSRAASRRRRRRKRRK